MPSSKSILFDRVFPPREWFRGLGLRGQLYGLLAAVLLTLLLLIGMLLAALLTDRGIVWITPAKLPHYEQLTGQSIEVSQRDVTANTVQMLVDQGLRSTVWHARGRFWAAPLASVCRNFSALRSNSSAWIFLVLGAALTAVLYGAAVSRLRTNGQQIALETATRLRKSIHRQALRLGPANLEDEENASCITLFTQDVELVQHAIFQWCNTFFRHVFTIALLVLLLLLTDWLLALECLIPLLGCWYLLNRAQQQFESDRLRVERKIDRQLRLLAESLRKTRLVRGYGMETFEHERFQVHLDRFRKQTRKLGTGESWSRGTTRLLVLACVTILVFLVGGRSLLASTETTIIPFPVGLLMLAACGFLFRSLNRLHQMWSFREDAEKAASRINEYLNRIPEVGQAVGARFLQPLSKQIQFESVTYALPDGRKLLDQFDLTIPAGSVTALIALDTVEAHAVAYMLPRFIEPQEGRVLLDGEDTAWATLESLRAEAIFVGSRDPFFTGTVFENVGCGQSEFRLQDVTEAAKQAHAHNFIMKLASGYETMLGEHGEQLDAGSAFRIGLARALIRNPALLIVEEPDDKLDEGTKALLDDAYSRLLNHRTVIFLPSRLSTVRRADTVVIVHEGKVAATGDYSQLLKTNSLLRHWEYVHFNEFRDLGT